MTCFQELEKDALELLKDQAKRIETLENVNAIDLNPKWPYVFNNYRKVVLCKNCKWYYANGGNCEQVLADWFCADGELKG